MGMAQNKFKIQNSKFKIMKLFGVAVFFLISFFIMIGSVYAESSYVLPYPSSMPGSLNYKLHLIYENLSRYWYFGNFGQFEYNLKMADKYLVEAKTLFDYKQYLLGYKALQKSDVHFAKIMSSLEKANSEKKNISQKKTILKEAVLKHVEVMEKIDIETPDIFTWQPEKGLPTNLDLKRDIENAISIRKNNL